MKDKVNKDSFLKNLTLGRYRNCGFGHPIYNRKGEYDEVKCGLNNGFCGEIRCPLDRITKKPKETNGK